MTPLTRRHSLHRLLGLALTSALLALPAWALDTPKGKVILTLSGKVGLTNSPAGAQFDLAMLQALPQHSFSTKTPWDKAPVKFTGPLLRDVLAAVKAQGQTLNAMALNDYKTSIPAQDAQDHDMLLAHQINDAPIPVRTKGPLFIIYPFDAKPELQAVKFYERSAWQLKSLSIE